MSINENKSKIEELYEEIGKKMYQHHVNAESIDADIELILEEYCIQIDELCDTIENARKELLTLKEKKECPNCFYEIDINYNYCPNCGIEQNEEINDKFQDEIILKDENVETSKNENNENSESNSISDDNTGS